MRLDSLTLEHMEPQCQACGKFAEKMSKCSICRDQFNTNWYGHIFVSDFCCVFKEMPTSLNASAPQAPKHRIV